MSQKTISRLTIALVEEIEGVNVMPQPYSGRFMFGKGCVGFALDSSVSPLWVFGCVLESSDRFDAEDREEVIADLIALAQDARTDQLGLGTVLYFPGFRKPD